MSDVEIDSYVFLQMRCLETFLSCCETKQNCCSGAYPMLHIAAGLIRVMFRYEFEPFMQWYDTMDRYSYNNEQWAAKIMESDYTLRAH